MGNKRAGLAAGETLDEVDVEKWISKLEFVKRQDGTTLVVCRDHA
jgi:hypothetical protein